MGVPFFDANGIGQLFVVNRPATSTVTSVSVNTTPDVFVGLFNKAVTDQSTGTASASYSQSLWGADLNYRLATPLFRERGVNVDVSAGFRYVNLSESLSLNTASTADHTEVTTFAKALGLPGNPNFTNSTSTIIGTSDVIGTHNNFIGPQFGAGGDFRLDERWSISGDAKVAVGANFESLSVSGSTTSTVTSFDHADSNNQARRHTARRRRGLASRIGGDARRHDEHNDKRQRDFRIAGEFRKPLANRVRLHSEQHA